MNPISRIATAVTAALVLTVAGCSQPAAPGSTDDTAAQEEAAPVGDGLLPAGIVLNIPRELRADRTYTNENGVERRRVTYEFVRGDIASTLASVERDMAAAGFTARPRQEQQNGNVLVQYVKDGYGDLLVYVGPVDAPRNPDAKGLLIYDFRTAP